MKVLFITTQLPYPPISGGVIKTFRFIEYLAQKCDLTVIAPLKNDEQKHVDAFLEKTNIKDCFFIPLNIKRGIYSLIMSYCKGMSLNMFRNYHDEIKEKVSELIQGKDIIIVDHYEMFQYVPEGFTGKVILHEHNAEFILWKRLSEIEKNPFKKLIIKLESNRVKKHEIEFCNKSDLIWAAPNDIEKLKKASSKPCRFSPTYHLGDDEMLQMDNLSFDQTQKIILYVGTLNWEANVNGLVWFIKESWPVIQKQMPEVKLFIVGKNPDKRIVSLAKKDTQIELKGFVKDLEPLFQRSRITIAPLLFGSGIKVKVLNSMYRGIPMVTTSLGVEGIEGLTKNHIATADNPILFAEECLSLLENKEKWDTLQKNSRALTQQKYTWSYWLNKHFKELESIVKHESIPIN